jgi:hypothetical protein
MLSDLSAKVKTLKQNGATVSIEKILSIGF